jgi:hypothetical protein
MDDLYTFIQGVVDLDLYGDAHGYTDGNCCADGEWAGPGCSCDDEAAERGKLCMFSYCLTWGELDARIDDIFAEMATEHLWFDLPLALFFSFVYAGVNGSEQLTNRDGSFWTRAAQILMVFTGAIAAYRSGVQAIQSSILGSTWTEDDGPGHSFAGYGGNTHIIGDFLGVFESIFSILFLLMSVRLVAGPLYLAYVMDKNLVNSQDETQDLTNLMIGCVIAMGSFFGGQMLLSGTDDIIDYFNLYNTGELETKGENTTAFLFDIILHSLESLMFLGLAWIVGNGCFHLAYVILTGEYEV